MQWRDELTRRFPALTKLGAHSYVVGGAIRDLLLGRDPADVDVACLDPLAAARSIHERVIRLGDEEHFSAYRVVLPGHVYDFAEILDHDIDADLARRDFTVNAMAVDLASGALLDPHGGKHDVEARLVRMVDATNFDDDPLRTLKGVRMAVKYGFAIEPATLAAIRLRAQKILDVAVERVTYELSVIFSSNAFRRSLALLRETGLDEPLGLAMRVGSRQSAVGRNSFSCGLPTAGGELIHADDVSLAGAYALLVADPRAYARKWRWSESLLRDVLALRQLVEHHDRIALFDAGESVARQLPAVLRALGRDDALDLPDFNARALLAGGEIASLAGIGEGKEIGRLKRALLEAQIREEVRTRDDAVAWIDSSCRAKSRHQ
jgi:tRNA nucleotidyltransferase/poly(A) polymerase